MFFFVQINGQILYGRSHQNATAIINNAPSKVKIILIRWGMILWFVNCWLWRSWKPHDLKQFCLCFKNKNRNKAAVNQATQGSQVESMDTVNSQEKSAVDGELCGDDQHIVLHQVHL